MRVINTGSNNNNNSNDININLGYQLDQSNDAINRVKSEIKEINKKVQDTKINLQVALDDEAMSNIAQQFQNVYDRLSKIDTSSSFDEIASSIQTATINTDQLNDAIAKIKDQSDLISQRTRFDLVDNRTIQQIRTYQDNLLQVRKIIDTFNKDGSQSTVIEDTVEVSKVQKQLYDDIKKINKEIFDLEKQKIKSDSDTIASLQQQQDIRKEIENSIRDTIKDYGLTNNQLEQEIDLANQLKQVQIDIATSKDVDTRSKQAYNEMIRLAKEEYRIKNKMIGQEGELANILEQRLAIVLQAKDDLDLQIQEEGLTNAKRYNNLLEERNRLKLDLLAKEEKLAQQESLRIAKLNKHIADIDFSELSFADDEAMKNFVLSLEEAGTQVDKFNRKISNGKNRQIELTTSTQISADKLRISKYVIDENTQSLYKLNEAQKEVINRNLSFLKQMAIAIERSVQWGLAMKVLYGSKKAFIEGIEIIKELDKELTQVSIITGKTKEEVRQLAQEYVVLGREMGKTVQEISRVNTELIRQGLSAEEAYSRMQTILKLSATGGLSADDTLSIITSSVNALGVEAERTANVLLKAGNISASSVSEIGESLTKTASGAKGVNMSLEELSATIAGLIEVTQESPSSLGNSVKTLIARFNKIDEVTGEVNQDFNDVQKAFESVGVSFLDSENQIRPFFELLSDMSEKWNDLDRNTKSYISTQSAGVRQANRFVALMDNFNRVQEINNELMRSGGTLNQNYVKYLNSVEASANRARVSFEQMWIEGLNSDVIKNYYEFITVINTLITRFNVFRVAISGIVAYVMLSNNKIRNSMYKLSETIVSNLAHSFNKAKKETKDANTVMKVFNTNIKKTSSATKTTSQNVQGLGKSMGVLTAKAIATKVAIVATQAVLTAGLSIAISGAISWIGSLIGKIHVTKEELENLTDSVKSNIETYTDNIQILSSISKEYEKLNEKLGENQDFTKLTADEQERYNQIANQINQIAPEVVKSYDNKGNAILDYKTKIEDLIKKERELIDVEEARLVSNESHVLKTTNKAIAKEEKNLKALEDQIKAIQSDIQFAQSVLDKTKDSDGRIGLSIQKDTQSGLSAYRAELSVLNQQRKVSINLIEQERNKQRELLNYRFKEIEGLEGITNSLKQIAKERIDQTLIDDGYQKATQEIGKFQLAFESMLLLLQTNTIDETNSQVRDTVEALKDLGFTSDEAKILIFEFTHSLDETSEALERISISMGIASSDFKEFSDNVKEFDSVLKKIYSGKNLGLDELTKLVDTYDEIAEYIAKTGDLSLKNGELLSDLNEKAYAQLMTKLNLTQQEKRLEIERGNEAIKTREKELDLIQKQLGVHSATYQQRFEEYEKAKNDMKALQNEYDQTTAKIKALGYVYGDVFKNNKIDNFANNFKEMTSQLDAYINILNEIEKYGTLSGETNREIVENHPELISLLGNEVEMRKVLNELIEEYKIKQWEAYKQSLMATEDFSKKILKSNQDLFNNIAKIYDLDLSRFTNLQNFKMQMLNQSTQMLSANGQTYLNTFETEAEKAVAELNMMYEALAVLDEDIPNYQIFKMFEGSSRDDILQRIDELEALISYYELEENAYEKINNLKPIDFVSTKQTSRASKTYKRIDTIELLTDRYLKFNKALEEVERSIQINDKLLNYAVGNDRIALLQKENDLLNERQQITHLLANEYRKEESELKNKLSQTIKFNDGVYGVDNFKKYSQQIEETINNIISQINKTTNDSIRNSLVEQRDSLQKAYDNVKQDFERYIELQNLIPNLGADWWGIEFEKFNKNLEVIDVNLEKYSKEIEFINSQLSMMADIKDDNEKQLKHEYQLLNKITNLYKDSLIYLETQMNENNILIRNYEKRLLQLGDTRNSEYQDINRRLIMARAMQDQYFENYQQNINALSTQIKTNIDNYTQQIDFVKNKTLDSLEEIRENVNQGFDYHNMNISINQILSDLDKIDDIFIEGVDFNLSTNQARVELKDWKNDIIDTMYHIEKLQSKYDKIINTETYDELGLVEKRDKIINVIEKQISQENELKHLEKDIQNIVSETALQHQKIENALEGKIKAKQDELDQLQKQFEQEDKIKQSLEKQLNLMRAMDDTRYSYITGQGEEVFTYDKTAVNNLKKEISQLNQTNERQEQIAQLQDEIEQMQLDLTTTNEINKQELEVLKFAEKNIGSILQILSKNIEDNKGGIDTIYTSMIEMFNNNLSNELQMFADKYENFWLDIIGRFGIAPVHDNRNVDITKLGGKQLNTDINNIVSSNKRQPIKNQAYTIQDSVPLWKLARQLNIPISDILKSNAHLSNNDILSKDDRINLPTNINDDNNNFNYHDLALNDTEIQDLSQSYDLVDQLINSMDQPLLPSQEIQNNSNKLMNIYNPTFQGINNMTDFTNEMSQFFRDSMPDFN